MDAVISGCRRKARDMKRSAAAVLADDVGILLRIR